MIVHKLPKNYMSITEPKSKNNSVIKGDYMLKHIKNELRIFIHTFKKRNNRKREQKSVYRATR